MRTIAHLSDLHFGRHDDLVVAALVDELIGARPDVVVISGDFTQRARRSQFRVARSFLGALHAAGLPTLSVPGNHDVPLYDVARRFLAPNARFRHYITAEHYPMHVDETVAVLGINTARSLTIKDGRVAEEQMACIAERFAHVPNAAIRVLVTHHPLVALPWGDGGEVLPAAGRSGAAREAAIGAGVDMLLAGHHHRPFAGSASAFVAAHGALLVVQAGTATSTRIRGDANSYNRIEATAEGVTIEVRAWSGSGFAEARRDGFRLAEGRWEVAG